jgi:hypothetical protein
MPKPKPRQGRHLGMPITNSTFPDGTWLEGEEFAYPDDTFTRRAYAECEDGVVRLVRCKTADTYFSIPARARIDGKTVRGFLTVRPGSKGLEFVAYQNQEQE